MGEEKEPSAVGLPNGGVVCLAKTRSGFYERVEYVLQIKGRATDHLEHVGGGGLLLQRLPQLAEQAGVLDCDHGLSGEVRHQLNLLFGENGRTSWR